MASHDVEDPALRSPEADDVASPLVNPDDEPLDHWYGFVVAVCVMLVQFSVYGISNSFSTFSHHITEDESVGKPSSSEVSVASSIATGIGPFVAVLAGLLSDRVGHRVLLVCATFFSGLSMLGASFATNPKMLAVFYGIPAGLASGCMSAPGTAAVSSWMKRRLPFAMGIAYSGNGLGSSVIVLVAGALADSATLTWRASFRLLAIFTLVGGIAALFVRHRRVTPSAAFAARVDEKNDDGECVAACTQDGPPAALKPNLTDTLRFLRVLLVSRAFHTIFWASATFSFYFFAMLYVVVPFGSKFGATDTVSPYMHYAEITTGKAATLFTFFGVTKWISSFIGGALSNKTDVSIVFAVGGAINAIACFMWGLCISYWQLALVCTFHGVGVAFMFATLPAAAGKCFAGPFVGLAAGLSMCGFCIGGFTGATVVTSLNAAHHNNFLPSFLLMGSMTLASAAIFLIGLGNGKVKQQHFATKEVLLQNREAELPPTEAASPIVGYAAVEA